MAGFWIVMFFFGPFFFLALLLAALQVALPVIIGIVMLCNILFLLVLLAARHFWKRSGTMDRSFIDQKTGLLHWFLLVLRYGLLVFIVWEIIVIVLCAAYLIFKPDLIGMLLGLLGWE